MRETSSHSITPAHSRPGALDTQVRHPGMYRSTRLLRSARRLPLWRKSLVLSGCPRLTSSQRRKRRRKSTGRGRRGRSPLGLSGPASSVLHRTDSARKKSATAVQVAPEPLAEFLPPQTRRPRRPVPPRYATNSRVGLEYLPRAPFPSLGSLIKTKIHSSFFVQSSSSLR